MEAPQPPVEHAACPTRDDVSHTASGWLTNSTRVAGRRDEASAERGERLIWLDPSPLAVTIHCRIENDSPDSLQVRESFTRLVALEPTAAKAVDGPRRPNA